jgi:hypothetical protein
LYMEAREVKEERLTDSVNFDRTAVQFCLSECIADNNENSASIIKMARPKRLPCDLFGLASEFVAAGVDITSENFMEFATNNYG